MNLRSNQILFIYLHSTPPHESCTVPCLTTSYQYKAIRAVKTHTRPGGASCYGSWGGVTNTHCHGDDGGDVVTTCRSFSAAASFTPGVSTTASRPPPKLICVTSPSSPRLQSRPPLHLDCADTGKKKKRSPVMFFCSKEVGGKCVCSWRCAA